MKATMNLNKDELRDKIVSLLRVGTHSANEIAALVNVTPQVVWGIKSHFSLGKYGDKPKARKEVKAEGTGSSWTYLILSERGEVYLGASGNLKSRLKSHNSPRNTGFTKGRRWHLLAAKKFDTPRGGFRYETELKYSQRKKREWKIESIIRAKKIIARFGYNFNPESWLPQVF